MTVRVDTFARANSSSLGASWTPWSWSGSGPGGLSVASNAAAATDTLSFGNWWSADSFGATQFSMICVPTLPTSGHWAGVTVRQSGNGGSGYLALYLPGTFYLFRETGVSGPPQLASAGGFMAAGDTLAIGASGSTITVYHNGTQVLQASDSTYASGSPGVAAYGNSARITPWIGGDGATPPFAALASTAGDGCQTWLCTSQLNGPSPTVLRITPPASPAAGYPHSFLYALPVSTGIDATYGDPVSVIVDDLGATSAYNTTLVVPSFANQPWYADNPSVSTMSYESFMVALQSWITASSFASGSEKHYLIGFSKSGLGGSALLYKHPALWHSGAFWDSPFMMIDYDGTDPTYGGTVGGNSAQNYGTSANFTSNYELSTANIGAWNTAAGGVFTSSRRIWTGGYAAFQADVAAYQALLTTLGVQRAATWSAADTHAWHDNWVASGLASTIPAATHGSGLLMASGII